MEHGLTESQRGALGVQQNKAYAMYDRSQAPPGSPMAIHYQSTYSVSEMPQQGRYSHEV